MAIRKLHRQSNSRKDARNSAKAIRQVTSVKKEFLFEKGDLVECNIWINGEIKKVNGIVTGYDHSRLSFHVIVGAEQHVVWGGFIKQALSR
jgi:hypothetical protein